jgi:hypothetical protein
MHTVQEPQTTITYNVNKSSDDLDKMFKEFEQLLNSEFFQRTFEHTKADAKNLAINFNKFIIKNLAEVYQCGIEQFFVRPMHNFEVVDQENGSQLKSFFSKALDFVAGDFVSTLHKIKSLLQKNPLGKDFVICSNIHGSNPILSYKILRGDSSESLIVKYFPIQKDLELFALIKNLNFSLDQEFSENRVEFICTNSFPSKASQSYFLAENLYKFLIEFQNSETGKQLQIKMFEADARDFRLNLYSTHLDDKYETNLLFTKKGFFMETHSVFGKRLIKFEQSEKNLLINVLFQAIEPDYYQFKFSRTCDFQSKIIEWLKSSAIELYKKEIMRSCR